MATERASTPDAVAVLIQRINQLEARVAALERPPLPLPLAAVEEPSSAQLSADSVLAAKFRARQDFEQAATVARLRVDSPLLAAVRAHRAEVNAYLVQRGLPPDPDPFPELP